MIETLKIISTVLTSIVSILLIVIRFAESIYELKKKPELDTFQEIIQVIKNFFTIETYGSNKEK